jgi:alkylated DNA repair protein (DNA oxidative demethylase)
MPACFAELAQRAAQLAGYPAFVPEACLINQYAPGAKLSLHQDRDEKDFTAPIVSVSLGLPAVFQFGGLRRAERTQRLRLVHGDVVVWGGPSRLAFHGVLPLADGQHALLGGRRINLTFRRVNPVG